MRGSLALIGKRRVSGCRCKDVTGEASDRHFSEIRSLTIGVSSSYMAEVRREVMLYPVIGLMIQT
jgi:hypothetical protein